MAFTNFIDDLYSLHRGIHEYWCRSKNEDIRNSQILKFEFEQYLSRIFTSRVFQPDITTVAI